MSNATSTAKTLEELQALLQCAVEVEMSTIPVYMTALFSMQDRTTEAYRRNRNVLMEEMFHVIQACNLLIALGGTPNFTEKPNSILQPYPKYLPYGNEGQVPFLPLSFASTDFYHNVCMAIETPAEYGAPPQGKGYDTIGQFYAYAQEHAIAYLDAGNSLPTNLVCQQKTNLFIGKFGGKLIEVTDKESMAKAILEIVQQGEGAERPFNHLHPREPWGVKDHYGMREDGQFGPIMGTPVELSHYFNFKRIADGVDPIGATYPMQANATEAIYAQEGISKAAKTLNDNFNDLYSILLVLLERSFKTSDDSDFFNLAMAIMHSAMPQLATQMMSSTPLYTHGDNSVGPNAAPTFTAKPEKYKDMSSAELEAAIKQLMANS